MMNFNPPEHVAFVLHHLTENGHAAFLVGGCVRDAVMGRHVHDWDVATSAAPVDVAMLFPKTVLTGEKFGTVTVLTAGDAVEVTTFRVESEYKDSRRPERVEFVENLDDDLSRRDFTMNAMAISVARRLIDPYGGIKDIKKCVIRCVGEPDTRFSEDALRMFRAFRFSAELGFVIEEKTLRAIYANSENAKLISAERVRVELEKTLLSHRPETAGEMIKTGLLARYLSKPDNCPDGLEKIEGLPAEPVMRWCAFCAILLEGRLIDSALEFLHSMQLDGKTVKTCTCALSIPEFPDNRTDIKRIFSKFGVETTRCAAAVHDIRGDCESRGDRPRSPAIIQGEGSFILHGSTDEHLPCLARVNEIMASGECFSLSKLAVSGGDLIALGHPPGQKLGEMLNMLLCHVLEHPKDNKRDVLLQLV